MHLEYVDNIILALHHHKNPLVIQKKGIFYT